MSARNRAWEAADHCRYAYLLISAAGNALCLPMGAADGDSGRTQAMVAEDLLVDASTKLVVAVSVMMAAEHVGLRGVAPNPAAPLRSFRDIGGATESERNLRDALELFRDARVGAENAWLVVQRGRCHLWAAYQLLDHERLPGVDGFLDNERVAAQGDLHSALQLAEGSVHLARTGLALVGRVWPRDRGYAGSNNA
jgi:hypothetical protein